VEFAAEDTSVAMQLDGRGPGSAQCVAKLVTSTHLPDSQHWIGLALRCTHQHVDTPATPEGALIPLCPAVCSRHLHPLPPLRLSFLLAAAAYKVATFVCSIADPPQPVFVTRHRGATSKANQTMNSLSITTTECACECSIMLVLH